MTIIVEDLDINIELDKEAMTSILGGWKNQSTKISNADMASANKIRWANTGKFYTSQPSANLLRTKTY